MSEKAPNYSDEAVEALHAGYDGEADEDERKAQVIKLAEALGKSPASIRAKLTREGIYKALTKAPAGKSVIRKAQLVAAIASKLNVDEDVAGSLEKANKNILKRVLAALPE